jgi:hypothetical protein
MCITYLAAMVVWVLSCKVWHGERWKPLVFCINNAAKLSFQSEAGMSNRNNSTYIVSFYNVICLSDL